MFIKEYFKSKIRDFKEWLIHKLGGYTINIETDCKNVHLPIIKIPFETLEFKDNMPKRYLTAEKEYYTLNRKLQEIGKELLDKELISVSWSDNIPLNSKDLKIKVTVIPPKYYNIFK